MTYPLGISLVLLLIYIDASASQLSRNKDELMNWCLNSKTHKHKPGKEDSLHKQCSPWKGHACCTDITTKDIHEKDMYNFTFDPCLEKTGKMMSDACRKHFIQDNCFYHCEPHIGLWVVETKRKIAKERFHKVPLCASDCDAWFKDCKHDYTCAYNWPRDFIFKKGRNYCNESSHCTTFESIYRTAKDFCENVWDESWQYTSDDEPCMHVWFNDSSRNPNEAVAEYYVDKYLNSASSISLNFLLLLCSVFFTFKNSILFTNKTQS